LNPTVVSVPAQGPPWIDRHLLRRTDIGAWHHGVPAAGKHIASLRQNLQLMIDGGRPAADLGCPLCWGATLGGVVDPARPALGIAATGVWSGQEGGT
jgi:hypothetical protein